MHKEVTSRKRTAWTFVAVAGIIAAIGYFIWPTPYIYMSKFPTVMRVNRFTGVQEWSTGTGWEGAEGPADTRELGPQVSLVDYSVYENVALVRFRNEGDADYQDVRFEFSLLNSQGVVVGRSFADATELRRGDIIEVKSNLHGVSEAVKLRLDSVLASR